MIDLRIRINQNHIRRNMTIILPNKISPFGPQSKSIPRILLCNVAEVDKMIRVNQFTMTRETEPMRIDFRKFFNWNNGRRKNFTVLRPRRSTILPKTTEHLLRITVTTNRFGFCHLETERIVQWIRVDGRDVLHLASHNGNLDTHGDTFNRIV